MLENIRNKAAKDHTGSARFLYLSSVKSGLIEDDLVSLSLTFSQPVDHYWSRTFFNMARFACSI